MGKLKHNRTRFTLKKLSLIETVKIIKQMKNSKSYGHDKIDPMSIKAAEEHLIKPINFITNLSIEKCKFANAWRIVCVIPIYKGGKKASLIRTHFVPSLCYLYCKKSSRNTSSHKWMPS